MDKKRKTSLVLEGGGMRGAFTAGALTWLIDNNIEFDNGYGISTGAVHLCNFIMKDKKNLYDFPIKYIPDKNAIGLRAFLRCGKLVDYNYLFVDLAQKINYSLKPLKDCKCDGYVGLYELEKGKAEYTHVHDLDMKELQASTTLPLIGGYVFDKGRHIMDAGVSEMIPIKQSVKDGCDKHLIITTKPIDYVRKPSKKIVVETMRLAYPKWPSVAQDYQIRDLNYNDQIARIKQLEAKGDALYIYPTKHSNVTRLGGSQEELIELFNLGYQDMEAKKEKIFESFK